MSLIESVIPTCLKQTTIVPVPVALTSVAMKCFERMVMAHINTIILETLDPLKFAYHPNRSTDDAISIALHTALSHLDKRNTYVKMLFIDYSSAINTIVPSKLITKLRILGLNNSLCNWIPDFLTGCPQGAPVLRISMADVLLPTITTWGWPVRKSRMQLQRVVFSPRVLSLVMSFVGTMVLKTEL